MGKQYTFVRTPDPVYVDTAEDAEYWVDYYMSQPAVGFDTETTGLHKLKARVKFFSMADAVTRICAPVRLLEMFAPILEDENTEKRMTNAKFDTHMVANHGIRVWGPVRDTTPQAWLYDENRQGRLGLKECCLDFLGMRMAPFSEVFGSIGSVDKEVAMVTRFHDILEAKDHEAAADVLVLLSKADGDEEVLQSLKHLALAKQAGYKYDAKELLKIARAHGLAPRTNGKLAYVSDFMQMMSGTPVASGDREALKNLLEDKTLLVEAHEFLLAQLRRHVKIDLDPYEMLKLLVGDYASLDAWGSFTLVDFFHEELENIGMGAQGNDASLWDYYQSTTAPYGRVLWNMERRGVPINLVQVDSYKNPMAVQIGKLEREVVRLVGHDVNLKSPDQMRDVFYTQNANGEWTDPFGDPPRKMTKGGASGIKMPSTDKEMIALWAEMGNAIAEAMVEHRQLTKLYDTFLTSVPETADHRNRLHTDLVQTGAVTGRLASRDPNLTNIPAKGVWGPKLREVFVSGVWGDCSPEWCVDELRDVPVPDYDPDQPMTFIVADYKQLEMVILAHFSEDQGMIADIKAGMDLHARNVVKAGRHHDYQEVVDAKKAVEKGTATPAQHHLAAERSAIKATGFGLNYGIGPVKLGRQLGYAVTSTFKNGRKFERCDQANKLIRAYFDALPGVEKWINETHENCQDDLFVQTYVGRFRRLPAISSYEKGIAAQAERQSVNSIIQGCKASNSFVMTEIGAFTLQFLYDLQETGREMPALTTYSGRATDYTIHDTGTKEIFEVETTHGTEFVTEEHRFFVYENQDLAVKQLRDLQPGSFILARANDANEEGVAPPGTTKDHAELIGVLCGDGSYTRDRDFSISIGNDFEWAMELEDLLGRAYPNVPSAIRRSNGSLGESWNLQVDSSGPRRHLLQLGLTCVSKTNKFVPRWMFAAPAEYRRACLRGLYDSDGGVSGGYVAFTNTSEHLARAFAVLSVSLGYFTRTARYSPEGQEPFFKVIVAPHQAQDFVDEIQPRCTRKTLNIRTGNPALPPGLLTDAATLILGSAAFAETHAQEHVMRNEKSFGTWKTRVHTSRTKTNFTKSEQAHVYRLRKGSGTRDSCLKYLTRLEDSPEKENLVDLAEKDWAEIRRITPLGLSETMDIEIHGNDHSYVGHGLLQHNSAADIVIQAMLNCEYDEELRRLGVRMLLQVHDELIFECPKIPEVVDAAKKRIKELMENPFPMRVPVLISMGTGDTWGAAKG